MVRNYKPRTDRATYDGALVARALEELDKGKSLRDVPNDLHIDNANSIPKSKRKLQQQNQGTRFPA